MMLKDFLYYRGVSAAGYVDCTQILFYREKIGSSGFQGRAAGSVRGQKGAVNVEKEEFHSSESSSGSSGGSSSVGGANRLFRLLDGNGEIVIPMLLPISFGSISAWPIEERSSFRRCINWKPSSL